MADVAGTRSASGVFIADDFRDHLIIDRYDPVFAAMRQSKLKHMRSENSEDVVTWNVFRTLRQVRPTLWLPSLMSAAFGESPALDPGATTVELWQPVAPPVSLLRSGDEGISEIDVVIESPHWVLFLEAKLTSDVSSGTTTRPDRDQLLRNIDVGTYYAGVRDFYFGLLVLEPGRSRNGAALIGKYSDPQSLRERLPHRRDGLRNLRGVALLAWRDIAAVVDTVKPPAASDFEFYVAGRCSRWLAARGI